MSAQHARLDLALHTDGVRTRPTRALATPPLQISRARYDNPANPAELQLTLTQLGGVLAGDCYELSVAIGPHAQATLVPAAASQIYTMPQGEAHQRTRIRTAPGSRLDWQTAPQILFRRARLRQQTRIDLAPGALAAFSEIFVAGRLAHGECWQFDHYASLVEVCAADGRVLAGERIVIEPGRRSPARSGVMGDSAVLGTLWLLGDGFAADALARRLTAASAAIGAAVLHDGCGMVVHVPGRRLATVQCALREYSAIAWASIT